MDLHPRLSRAPFFSELPRERVQARSDAEAVLRFRKEFDEAAAGQRDRVIERHLLEQIGKVLHLSVPRIDRHAPFADMGIDSLTSLELRNRLEATFGLKLSPTLFFTYSNAAILVKYLLEQLEPSTGEVQLREDKATGGAAGDEARAQALEGMSEKETESLLEERLASFEEYLK
jgi:epothilone polyketide synthase E